MPTIKQTVGLTNRWQSLAAVTVLLATPILQAAEAPDGSAPEGDAAVGAAATAGAGAGSNTVASSLGTSINAAGEAPSNGLTALILEDYREFPIEPGKPYNDLLERLRDDFALTWSMNPRIQAELSWFVRHPEYMDRVFTRAQRFLPHIIDELERRRLPMELALLPIVESAFDPFAYSHGRAAGLWQIIPGTGRRFKIEQNWWYDGRRDILDSTRGALDYLTALHKMMDGDWMLAIASYNSGEGNVLRGVRRNKAAGKPTDFWNISVPRETRSYVPRLLALVELVREPEKYGLELPSIIDEPQFEVVETAGQIDLALAAELAGIDLDTLYGFNPGLNQWATDPDGPHRIVLPSDRAVSFQQALANVPQDQWVRWKRHKVANGQTLSEIAERYNTTVRELRSANNLRGNVIRAGHHLMIPMATEPLTAYVQSADARRDKIQGTSRSGNKVEHVVTSGESFWSIGQRYGVGTRELAKWNAMAPRDTLSIGQKLVVWTDAVPAGVPQGKNLTRKLRYTVRKGDSLYLIANRFRVTVNDLLRWNSIDAKSVLRPGQSLTMFVNVTEQSS